MNKLIRDRRNPLVFVSCLLALPLISCGGSSENAGVEQAPDSASSISAAEQSASVSTTSFRDCDTCPEMVLIPAGSFVMGTPPEEEERWGPLEEPIHKVDVAGFAIGRYEVTRGEFAIFAEDTGLGWPDPIFSHTDRHPAVHLTWANASAYARWLGEKTGEHYRLPTEAEWEYAARAGTTSARYWENDEQACEYASVSDKSTADVHNDETPNHVHPSAVGVVWGNEFNCDDGYGDSAPVGSFKANAFGLHDMLGNVWEWVEDCAHGNYEGAPTDGSAWNTGGDCSMAVLRGGSWGDLKLGVRLGVRKPGEDKNTAQNEWFGFRVAKSLL